VNWSMVCMIAVMPVQKNFVEIYRIGPTCVHFFIIVLTVGVAIRTHSNEMLRASNQPDTCSLISKQILFLCILDALTSLAGFFFYLVEEH